ncbi:hydrogenase 3 maturation endopeptidase HyCI [Arabiibacter massiliensis]|uniref:hydrogenase 3 maturation endopeptidase HyCI n=1 Tax=Arabiibacter massiliensis TaxID=1870985 RepID=UPI0009B932A5|nr:hydrogenase 3 maturation endopeptidase HyCI [Arabiibacter massiliensis]
MSGIVFTVGSVLRGDDAAGPMLAKMLEDDPVEGWDVVDGGQTPEDDLAVIRRAAPERIVLVDAAQMGLWPGAVRRLGVDDVARQFLITTHSLPISFLLGELQGICDDVTFLGIQLRSTEFFEPLSPEVRAALDDIAACLRAGGDFSGYATMDG